jgi:DNA-binding NarL/FixJ family response regulator
MRQAIRRRLNPVLKVDNSTAIATSELMLLSPRERQVLDLMVSGESDKYIAEQFHITYATAKNHIRSIGVKLRIRGYGKRLKTINLLAKDRIPLPEKILTPRQYQLCSLVCKGKSYKDISLAIGGNMGTIKQTMHTAYDKLGCDTMYELCSRYTTENKESTCI